ncbi:MAG: hypothetical protein ABEK59_03685 [Halobacteria archaeon]
MSSKESRRNIENRRKRALTDGGEEAREEDGYEESHDSEYVTDDDPGTGSREDHGKGTGHQGIRMFLRPTLKFILALVFLYVAEYLTSTTKAASEIQYNLPKTSHMVSVQEIIHGIITILVFIAILKYGYDVGTILKRKTEMRSPRRLSMVISGIISFGVVYWMSLWVVDIYTAYKRTYDVAFLIVELVLLALLVLALYRNIERI